MKELLVMIGSNSDKPFLREGCKFLDQAGIKYDLIASSTHRDPHGTGEKIREALKNPHLKAIIAGAATATGLPGVVAGYLVDTNILILGVRFINEQGPNIFEDATYNLSSMPKGVPLAYTGFNDKGFYHACLLAARILKK